MLWEQADTERDEAEFVARGIQGLLNEEDRALGDIAVLYRTHAQSRVLEEMFRRYQLNYKIVGGVSFFQRREIKDIRAYLRLAMNNQANSAFERIINVPARGIGKTTVKRIRDLAQSMQISMLESARRASVGQHPQIKNAASKKLLAFLAIVDHIQEVIAAGASVSETIIQAVEKSGYRGFLEKDLENTSQDRLANLSELVAMASEYDDEMDGAGSLVEFEERIALTSSSDGGQAGDDAITCMTIHAAKGLEFPIVFLCGMEDGLFPSIRENQEIGLGDKSIEEERRLAYVAFTRAKERLVLSTARMRRQWADIRVSRPSRFIYDVPEHCLAIRAKEKVTPKKRSMHGDVLYDEFDQRSFDDDYSQVENNGVKNDASFHSGQTIKHPTFGMGLVVEAKGQGHDQKILVNFPDVGLKTILSRYVSSCF